MQYAGFPQAPGAYAGKSDLVFLSEMRMAGSENPFFFHHVFFMRQLEPIFASNLIILFCRIDCRFINSGNFESTLVGWMRTSIAGVVLSFILLLRTPLGKTVVPN